MARPIRIIALALLTLGVTLAAGRVPASAQALSPGQPAPEIGGASWINSAPLTMSALRGRVVLVEFWTYG